MADRTLLTYGDSNTHGTPPIAERGVFDRHPAGVRWPTVAHARLGAGWRLVEEGLPGRTTSRNDPVMGAHMNGWDGLKIALMSHAPVDVLTIMLGTNDVKARFTHGAGEIAAGVAGLIDIAQSVEMQARTGPLRILVICPPPVEEAGVLAGEFYGGRARALDLPPLLRDLAAARGCGFLDAGRVIRVSPVDGVHFDAAAHVALGEAVAAAIRAL